MKTTHVAYFKAGLFEKAAPRERQASGEDRSELQKLIRRS